MRGIGGVAGPFFATQRQISNCITASVAAAASLSNDDREARTHGKSIYGSAQPHAHEQQGRVSGTRLMTDTALVP